MATKIKEFVESKRGREDQFDDAWFDGNPWALTVGEDVTAKTKESAGQSIRHAARRRDKKVKISFAHFENGVIYVQATGAYVGRTNGKKAK